VVSGFYMIRWSEIADQLIHWSNENTKYFSQRACVFKHHKYNLVNMFVFRDSDGVKNPDMIFTDVENENIVRKNLFKL